jgi:hypothetical protein
MLTPSDLHLVVFYSLLCGATSLIPIPFLDDWIYAVLRRYLARDLLASAGLKVDLDQARFVVQRPSRLGSRGCLLQLIFVCLVVPGRAVLYVLKKVFRKLVIILAVKEGADRASETFHEAYFLALAGRQSLIEQQSHFDLGLVQIRDTVAAAVEGTDTSVLRNLFRGVIRLNRATFSRAGRFLVLIWRRLRGRLGGESETDARQAIRQQEEMLGSVTRVATEKILCERGYLVSLEESFQRVAQRTGLSRNP